MCTNIWAPLLAEKTGTVMPLFPGEHQYIFTDPVPALAEIAERHVAIPVTAFDDLSIYFRQHGDHLGIGSYAHPARLVDPKRLPTRPKLPVHPRRLHRRLGEDATPHAAHFSESSIADGFNGMFSFTVDDHPILGETTVRGLWAAVGAWLSFGSEVGAVMARWMTTGDPGHGRHAGPHRPVSSPSVESRVPEPPGQVLLRDRIRGPAPECGGVVGPRAPPCAVPPPSRSARRRVRADRQSGDSRSTTRRTSRSSRNIAAPFRSAPATTPSAGPRSWAPSISSYARTSDSSTGRPASGRSRCRVRRALEHLQYLCTADIDLPSRRCGLHAWCSRRGARRPRPHRHTHRRTRPGGSSPARATCRPSWRCSDRSPPTTGR